MDWLISVQSYGRTNNQPVHSLSFGHNPCSQRLNESNWPLSWVMSLFLESSTIPGYSAVAQRQSPFRSRESKSLA